MCGPPALCSHGWRSLEGYSPWGGKESDMTEQLTLLQSGRGIPWYAWAAAIEGCYKREMGFPGGADGKEPTANAGDIRDVGSILEPGRSPEGGHINPLQYSCLENPMNRGAWRATVHRVTKSLTRLKLLSIHALINLRHHSSVDIYQWQQMFSEFWIGVME